MKILLGITGGIAAYKSLELTRLFIKAGHEVQVVMTAGAKAFIQPLSFQALSGKPVRDSLFDCNQEAGMGHIELARWADQIVIAPASAETLAKLRMGRADDLLTTLCLATDKPMMVVPAMNRLMWSNEATQENVQVLKQRNFEVLEPDEGEQACGEVGAGRMPEPQTIFEQVMLCQNQRHQFEQRVLEGQVFWQNKTILITAGPTFEDIDPVRFIGNRSSGKMGFALAEAAQKLGAKVTLIAGPVHISSPPHVERVDVRTADQMFEAVQKYYAGKDFFISAAAVADFKVTEKSEQKLKKQPEESSFTLSLVKNVDIVAWVAKQPKKPFVVGFAAETENVLEYAKRKRIHKNLDAIIANEVGEGAKGFESDRNCATLITRDGQKIFEEVSKKQLGFQLLDAISSLDLRSCCVESV
ncbi:Phosphopantothenoylcysteine decarboxylase / Phosphopantothenoylcysteine synthetase [hydrothermal vent metagenome]|uniref:Phosphopantothenoylcysteine decarboxylase / Phosphopantothenoylcysteine synthetase n=1 Tax=hydrothermal vent metagenome TaxID=652676 RepID=A0A3B0WAD5_9ZZZZ